MPTTRECRTCRKTKPLDHFYRDLHAKGGRMSRCQVCEDRECAVWLASENERRARVREGAKASARAAKDLRDSRVVAATTEPFTDAELLAVWAEADAWACVYCGAPWAHRDHFYPVSRGGENAIGNIWPACARCNSSKNARDPWEFLRSLGI